MSHLPAEAAHHYLDHAASAPLLPEARAAVVAALELGPGNPGSAHAAGRALRAHLEDAREEVAAAVAGDPRRLVFTSGSTESVRLGLLGLLEAEQGSIVASRALHPTTVRLIESLGGTHAWLTLDRSARVTLPDQPPTAARVLVLDWVESVTGTRQDLVTVLRWADEHGLTTLIDATQAVGKERLHLAELEELAPKGLSVAWSAHKLGGPTGIGALHISEAASWSSPWGGGSQELGRRAGTEAVALAAGFAAAARVVEERRPELAERANRAFVALDAFAESTEAVSVFGDPTTRVATTRLLMADGARGDRLAAALDAKGFRVSAGTACASGARTPPAVLLAAGRTEREARGALRVSIGWGATPLAITALVRALSEIVPGASGGRS